MRLASGARKSGQRQYSQDLVYRVRLIQFATSMGFSLSEIRIFLAGLRERTLSDLDRGNSPREK
jgi:DNA-binding transcriptional MerR regulator